MTDREILIRIYPYFSLKRDKSSHFGKDQPAFFAQSVTGRDFWQGFTVSFRRKCDKSLHFGKDLLLFHAK